MEPRACLVDALALTITLVIVGRIALAWLPPGAVGSHRPGELPTTLAVSALLAGGIGGSLGRWAGLLGWTDWVLGAGLAAAVALVARWATLPGAMVPRHAPPAERADRWTRLVLLAVAVASLARTLDSGARAAAALEAGSDAARQAAWSAIYAGLAFLAAAIALLHGARTARRAPLERGLIALAFVVTAPVLARAPELAHGRAAFVLGLACAIGWWRRADRRALALAALLFGSCAASSATVGLALAGAIALVAATARSARGSALRWAAASALVLGLPALFAAPDEAPAPTLDPGGLPALPTLGLLSALSTLALALALSGRLNRGDARPTAADVDEPYRSAFGVGLAVTLGAAALTAAAALGWTHGADRPPWEVTLHLLAPAAWLAVGLACARAERPFGRAGAAVPTPASER